MSMRISVRELRAHFPQLRQWLDSEGEVLITVRGRPRYRLTLCSPAATLRAPPPKDYLKRLRKFQPRAMAATQSEWLHHANRGDRND